MVTVAADLVGLGEAPAIVTGRMVGELDGDQVAGIDGVSVACV